MRAEYYFRGADLKLNQVHVEEVVLNAKGERGIRLDAWAVSEDSRHFATEMQNDSDIDDVRKHQGFIRDFWTVRY